MKRIVWKNRKPNKRTFLSMTILFMILCTLTGCFPNNYTREEKKAFLREAPFPTLSSVIIYHIAEGHALHEGNYSALPILSKETMELRYSQDIASYTRYQTLEQDGLKVIYNAYEWTREQDTVTESVITEEDITLTVTDEFIRLECTKDNYSIYLSTKDKNITKKYRYVFLKGRAAKGEKTQKGVWYSFEDGYVYAYDELLPVPYEINGRHSKGNVIYSSPQK